MAVVRDYTALLGPSSWTSAYGEALPAGRPTILTYSFPSTAPLSYAGGIGAAAAASFQPFNDAEKTHARQALEQYASASGLTFYEVSGERGDIRFSWMDGSSTNYGDLSKFGGWAFYPGHMHSFYNGRPYFFSNEAEAGGGYADFGGDAFGNLFKRTDLATGGGALHLWLHEVGHALGLKHPFEGDTTLATDLDTYANTVMSYTSGGSNGRVLGPLDVAAVQHLYGGPGSDGSHLTSLSFARATETLYMQATSGPDRTRGTGTHDHIAGGGGNDTIYGASGDDVIAGGAGLDVASGGIGRDLYMTGTAYTAGAVSRSFQAGTVEVRVPEGVEFLTDFESIRFTNGDFDVATMTFRPDAGDDVFRFYNAQTKSHFYTMNVAERDEVQLRNPDFAFEFNAFDTDATAADGLPVYRFYNEVSRSHFYTANAAERDQIIQSLPEYRYEGPAYYAFGSAEGGEHIPLYRFYQSQSASHFYTASLQERDQIIATLPQYAYEGVAYYVDWA